MGRALILAGLIIFASCYYKTDNKNQKKIFDFSLTDSKATAETQALYFNLKKLSSKYILFGQQDATAYGIGWKNEDLRSDINDVCGSFPSIYGWDAGALDSKYYIDSISNDRVIFWIKSAYERGGINTISWHLKNPVTGKSCTDTTSAVKAILPGGPKNSHYIDQLNLLADFFLNLKSKKGTLIPVIFRPFHEQNKEWFWWGASHCSPQEYKELWRFTVDYLCNKREVHNLLFAYSPDVFYTSENYLERFPGKEYVDILGFDNYMDFEKKDSVNKGISQLRIVVNLAKEQNKIAALTETGLSCISDENWYTESLLNPIKADSIAENIAYIMVWRNDNPGHFYAPYPGHASIKNFIKFENDPVTLFEDDLPAMYEIQR